MSEDPASSSRISAVMTAAICMKPRLLLTERPIAMLGVPKNKVPGFAVIRNLAIRFQGLLRHHDKKIRNAVLVLEQRPDGRPHQSAQNA